MPSNLYGLIEMAFVFSMAIGWGLFELHRLRRLRRPPPPPPKPPDELRRDQAS